jgi:hypothetical protein
MSKSSLDPTRGQSTRSRGASLIREWQPEPESIDKVRAQGHRTDAIEPEPVGSTSRIRKTGQKPVAPPHPLAGILTNRLPMDPQAPRRRGRHIGFVRNEPKGETREEKALRSKIPPYIMRGKA